MIRNISGKQSLTKMLALAVLFCVSPAVLAQSTQPSEPLQEEIRAIKARGEPWEPEDFAQPEIAPEENVLAVYQKAHESIHIKGNEWEVLSDTHMPLTPEQLAQIDAIIVREASALQDIRRATSMSGIGWQIKKLDNEVVKQLTGKHTKIFGLTNLVHGAALRAQSAGNDQEALLCVQDMLGIQRAIRKIPLIVDLYLSNAVSIRAAQTLQDILPSIIQSDEKTRLLLVKLRNDLLEEHELMADQRLEIWGERRLVYLSENNQLATTDPEKPATPYARALLLRYMGQIAVATNYAEAHAALPQEGTQPAATPKGLEVMAELNFIFAQAGSTLDQAMLMRFRSIAFRRMAAVAITIKLYSFDHAGAIPPSLDSLVKAGYLSNIPRNPMTADRFIQYNATGEMPLIYCDYVEDGKIKRPSGFFKKFEQKDFQFPLRLQPAAATQPN